MARLEQLARERGDAVVFRRSATAGPRSREPAALQQHPRPRLSLSPLRGRARPRPTAPAASRARPASSRSATSTGPTTASWRSSRPRASSMHPARWAGGRAHLVQVGDVLDRGLEGPKALDLLIRLEAQAQKAGGRVHALLGNHEVMNMLGDLRYVSADEYKQFRTPESERRREHALRGVDGPRARRREGEGREVRRDRLPGPLQRAGPARLHRARRGVLRVRPLRPLAAEARHARDDRRRRVPARRADAGGGGARLRGHQRHRTPRDRRRHRQDARRLQVDARRRRERAAVVPRPRSRHRARSSRRSRTASSAPSARGRS